MVAKVGSKQEYHQAAIQLPFASSRRLLHTVRDSDNGILSFLLRVTRDKFVYIALVFHVAATLDGG